MTEFDYDFFVIGGGSGGLAAAHQAASLKVKVAVADFVKPSPAGTTWGLGGTCVNVGCIPKKLMHISSLFRETQGDVHPMGWETKSSHSWSKMVKEVDQHIKGINWSSKTELQDNKIKYYNKFATFLGPNKLLLTDKKGATEEVTAKYILVACGGRPNLGGYPGAEECCISSDDVFWKTSPPGKTLVIGASYIALECAGFIAGFGFDVTVMVRSILLRGFDETCATRIGEYMESKGVKFAREMVPSKFEKTADGKIKVFVKDAEYGIFDTVFVAIGRQGCANQLNLEAVGIPVTSSGKIEVGEDESTKVPSIFAVGDVCEGKPELTPVAIQAGKILVNRLFGGSKKLMDYTDIATTVFTPLEYGTIGFSEEAAIKKFGKEKLTIYHALNQPLEWQLNDHRKDDYGYFKVICDKTQNEKVIGAHVLGPNAGEVIQCLGVAFKAGFTKEHLDDCVGIHPTFAEKMTTMTDVKVEGKDIEKPGGC